MQSPLHYKLSAAARHILRRTAEHRGQPSLHCVPQRERVQHIAAATRRRRDAMGFAATMRHFLAPVVDEYSDPNAWNSDEHFPIKLALALAAAALALAAAQRAQKRTTTQKKEGVLGEKCDAPETYSPDVLFPIPRTKGRRLLGLEDGAPIPCLLYTSPSPRDS